MKPDGKSTGTIGDPVEPIRSIPLGSSAQPIASLGDGSFLVPIYLSGSTWSTGSYQAYSLGRFFVNGISAVPDSGSAPSVLRGLQDRRFTVQSGFREPLVLSAVFRSVGTNQIRWFFEGQLLAGETNAFLSIANPSVANSGSYRIEVSNGLGTAATEAKITVVEGTAAIPSLEATLKTGVRPLHLEYAPHASSAFALEASEDMENWRPITDPAVRVSNSEYAVPLDSTVRFYRLAYQP